MSLRDAWEHDIKISLAVEYFVRLDMLPVPYRRKVGRYENWLGLALFLPSYLFVLWKLLMG